MTEMTWEELVNKAKELGLMVSRENIIKTIPHSETIVFKKAGEIYVSFSDQEEYEMISKNRTPSQMYQIMLALED